MAIRIGIIGANLEQSWASRSHIPALLASPDFEITAVCTTRQESAEAAARYTGAQAAYTDARALANDPDVDVVTVCVKVPAHREPVLHALEAGKHVYSEWPLGANTSEAVEMAEAARAAGVVTMVGLQAQAAPAVERARELVAEGYLGRMLAASLIGTNVALGGPELPASMVWAVDRAKGASVLTIPAGHAMDALFSCVGEPQDVVASIRTQTTHARDPRTGDEVTVTSPDQVILGGTLAEGGAYSIHVQGGTVGTGFRLGLHGTEGVLVISTAGQGVQHVESMLEGARAGEPLAPIDVSARRAALPEGQAGNVGAMYERLARAIREGTPAFPDFEHALARHRFLDAAVAASDTGARQTV